MEIIMEAELLDWDPGGRQRGIESARNIIKSIPPIKHVSWLVGMVFDKWGSSQSAYPAINKDEIREFGNKNSYASSDVALSRIRHDHVFHDEVEFKFKGSSSKPNIYGTFSFGHIDAGRPLCENEYCHELAMKVITDADIFHIIIKRTDSRGVKGMNGTSIKIAKAGQGVKQASLPLARWPACPSAYRREDISSLRS